MHNYVWLGHNIAVRPTYQGTGWIVTCKDCSLPASIVALIQVMAEHNFQHIVADGQSIEHA